MNKTRVSVVSVGLVTFLLACGFVFAQPAPTGAPGGARMKKHKQEMEKMVKELGITADQQAKLKQFREQHREEMKSTREKVRTLRTQLRDELNKPQSNDATIAALTAQIKDLEGKMVDARVQGVLEMKSVLTPEQFKAFNEKIESKKQERGKCKSGCQNEK